MLKEFEAIRNNPKVAAAIARAREALNVAADTVLGEMELPVDDVRRIPVMEAIAQDCMAPPPARPQKVASTPEQDLGKSTIRFEGKTAHIEIADSTTTITCKKDRIHLGPEEKTILAVMCAKIIGRAGAENINPSFARGIDEVLGDTIYYDRLRNTFSSHMQDFFQLGIIDYRGSTVTLQIDPYTLLGILKKLPQTQRHTAIPDPFQGYRATDWTNRFTVDRKEEWKTAASLVVDVSCVFDKIESPAPTPSPDNHTAHTGLNRWSDLLETPPEVHPDTVYPNLAKTLRYTLISRPAADQTVPEIENDLIDQAPLYLMLDLIGLQPADLLAVAGATGAIHFNKNRTPLQIIFQNLQSSQDPEIGRIISNVKRRLGILLSDYVVGERELPERSFPDLMQEISRKSRASGTAPKAKNLEALRG